MVMLRLPSQGGLPFLSNPTSTTGAGPTTLQQGPPLLPQGTIQGDPQIRTWPSLLLLPCLPVLLQNARPSRSPHIFIIRRIGQHVCVNSLGADLPISIHQIGF